MSQDQSSYRQIMKATSVFGGVQVFKIIISIIRSKIVAVLLEPTGMGIHGLLTSTTDFIGRITNLGLSTSAVRNIAAANSSGDKERVRVVVTVLRRLVWYTGILGTIFTLVFAPWLSKITFGNKDYTIAFVCISVILLLTQINAGQLVILQGMRKIKFLGKANVAGSAFALLFTVPVYYIWGIKGIVPAIIINSLIVLLFSWYYSSRMDIKRIEVNRGKLFSEGGDMVKMGFFLSLNSIISISAAYLIRIFISHRGSVEQVGLYTAGFTLINTYVGMVFSAMSTDYFPRLSGFINENEKAVKVVNQQTEIAILILAPILAVFLIFINFIVILLYSTKFTPVEGMIHWAALGIFFKAVSWPISYLFIAKGHTRLFFNSELIAKIYFLSFNILGYMWKGLNGLGISFLLGFFLYAVQVSIIAYKKYSYSFEKDLYRIFGIQFILGLACFLTSRFLSDPYIYIVGAVLILISSVCSFRELNKRLKLIALIKEKMKRNN